MSIKKIFYGHYIVGACMVTQMMYLGLFFTFSVLFPEFEREFGWSRAQIAGAHSTMFVVMGVVGVFMGRVNDQIGPRLLLTVSTIVFALGFTLMSRIDTLAELYLFYGLLGGLGLAAHDVATLSTVARWFRRGRGLMSGFVKSGAGIGQVVIPLLAAVLIVQFGWRNACLIAGIVAMVVMVVASQVMRRDPAALGLRPWGEKDSEALDRATEEEGLTLREATRTRQFWLICLAKLADWYCLFTIIVHIVPYAIDQGLEKATAVGVLSAVGGCSILGRLTMGGVFDILGARRSLMICFALLFSSFILLQQLPNPSWLFLFALFYGVAHGGLFAVASPTVAEFFGTRSHGLIFGIVLLIGTIGGTAGPWISGKMFDVANNYDVAFLVLTVFTVFGFLLAFSLRSLVTSDAVRAS